MEPTGMPSEGRSGISTPFTGRLSDKHESIVNEGIGLFEIEKISINKMGTADFGYYDVVVTDIDDGSGIPKRDVYWRMGQEAYIRYEPDRKLGRCYGFIPDDKWWHNRIMLASNIKTGDFEINRYFNQRGIILKADINAEIRYIEDQLHDWSIVIGKEVQFRSKNVEEIQKTVAEFTEKGIKVQTKYSKVAPVEQIIRKYGHRWLMCEEFQNGFLAALKERVDAKFKPEVKDGAVTRQLILDVIKGLSPQERLQLMSEAEVKSDAPAVGKKLADMNHAEASKIAKAQGIDIVGKNTGQIKAAIADKAGLRFDLDDIPKKESITEDDKVTF